MSDRHDHEAGFTTGLRPKARVRASNAEDLAVTDDRSVMATWLLDNRHAICVKCGHKISLAQRSEDLVAGILAHNEGCYR